MSVQHPEIVWCVEFWFDTTMWNEGFDNAELPWLRFYTADTVFVESLVHEITIPTKYGSSFPTVFNIKKYQTIMQDDDESATHLLDMDESFLDEESDRYIGFVDGVTDDELLEIILDRLLKWDGL